mmetsp:Transcript_27439/g.73832  ORF Transcript_27439/g.73832 Transcript_27439/m.73832 type:complete len:247 (+) Transcript_27439:102-842(+)
MRRVQREPVDPARPLAFSVVRVPFFLEPGYDEDEAFSVSNRTRLERKWGGREGWLAQKSRHRLKERALEAGITERFDLDRPASNTLKSHRMVQWVSRTRGLVAAERLYDALNVAHFVHGRKLNDAAMLVDAAVEHAGVDAAEAHAFLASDDGREEISSALELASRFGIHSIPKFVVNGAYVLDGAAHAEDHVRVFRQLEERGESYEGTGVFARALRVPKEILMAEESVLEGKGVGAARGEGAGAAA